MTKQGYKQTEVGLIPEDWEVSTLDEYLEEEDPELLDRDLTKNQN